MVQPCETLSVRRQCELLNLNRSTIYYEPVGVSEEELVMMRRIDEIYLKWPFYGSRRIAVTLSREGRPTNRKLVQRLMRLMGLEGMAPGPSTSKPRPEHKKYPYLLKGLKIVRPNQVWSTDITYLPLAHGYGYLVAIMDWFSRAVLGWRISNTLTVDFCIEALQEALHNYPSPEIFNTDQGAQFTSEDFIKTVEGNGIRMSMDGKGRCVDNIFVERLWRSLKYEEVYLRAYEDLREARERIGKWLYFYNTERPHQALNYLTPQEIHSGVRAFA